MTRGAGARMAVLAAVLALTTTAAGREDEKDPAAAKAEAAKWIEVLKREPGRRAAAAAELGRIGPPAGAAIEALVSVLGDRDEEVRGNVVWALGKIAGLRYEPVVVPFKPEYIAKHYPPTEDRKANSEPLVKLALPALQKALADKSDDVRVNAAYALGCMEELAKDAAPLLARALLKDDDRRVRANAAWALTKVPGTAKAVMPALKEAAASKDEFIRHTACHAIGWYGADGASALPVILKAMDAEPGGRMSRKMNYLGVIGNMEQAAASAVPRVAPLLDSKDWGEVASAAWCLGKIRTGVLPSVPRLTELLGSDDGYVRWNVAWALGRLGPDAKSAVAELRRVSEEDPEPRVRANALQALSIISGVAVPTGTNAEEPTGSGAGGSIIVSSGDTIQVVK